MPDRTEPSLPAAAGVGGDIANARRVLTLEAEALQALAAAINGTFAGAIERLAHTTGRVVVTGMGKSGYVARKIAATLASTGTPAQFVHPGEASHGDLGMITPADAVLALSNSGETSELSDLVAYSRRHAIPLIAITSVDGSTLARAADIALILPAVPEACPMGLAPTTSSTMMLALGDAIAIALLQRRGFTADDFRTFHPGGKLGRILVRVETIMHGPPALPLVQEHRPMSDAILEMSRKGFGCVGVVDARGRLIGIITDGDLRRHMGDRLLAQSAGTVMTRMPKVIRSPSLAVEALALMNARHITSLFVVAGDADLPAEPVGILHVHDCLRAGIM